MQFIWMIIIVYIWWLYVVAIRSNFWISLISCDLKSCELYNNCDRTYSQLFLDFYIIIVLKVLRRCCKLLLLYDQIIVISPGKVVTVEYAQVFVVRFTINYPIINYFVCDWPIEWKQTCTNLLSLKNNYHLRLHKEKLSRSFWRSCVSANERTAFRHFESSTYN